MLVFSSQIFAEWLQGKPMPDQKTLWAFETSYKSRISSSKSLRYVEYDLLTAELGFYKNVSSKKSVGVSLYMSSGDIGTMFGIKYRQRDWLAEDVSLELAPGVIFASKSSYTTKQKAPSLIGSATLNLSDLLSFELHLQAIRYSYRGFLYNPNTQKAEAVKLSGTQPSAYIGIKFGSFLAVGSVVITYVIAYLIYKQTEVTF